MQVPEWLTAMRQQWDSWAQQQRALLNAPPRWPPWHWKLKLPWQEDKKQKDALQEEYHRRKMQIDDLCKTVQADDLSELQDLLGAMILAECVYKRPETELLRAINSFKADFGGQIISLCRVQPSLDHVPHRYILAEGGETLFAAFAGTKQYRDFITDANFLQGSLFNDNDENETGVNDGDGEIARAADNDVASTVSSAPKAKLGGLGPAAHRGFLARAKGIPAVELYRLAQKKDRKLVLCGHSLGGAVAVLATLAILRVFATASVAKAGGKLQIKCITFSQPPVGNGPLRDYVENNGWQNHFRTFCIPEDIIPRILSPAYFQHYRSQASSRISQVTPLEPADNPSVTSKDGGEKNVTEGSKAGGVDQASSPAAAADENSNCMVLGVGPLPKYLWRLPKLAPVNGRLWPFQWFKDRRSDVAAAVSNAIPNGGTQENIRPEGPVQVLPPGMQENKRSGSLSQWVPASDASAASSSPPGDNRDAVAPAEMSNEDQKTSGGDGEPVIAAPEVKGSMKRGGGQGGNGKDWLRRVPSVPVPSVPVPTLPSYVPFGQLYFLEKAKVVPLSTSEYTQLISVQSVFEELRGGFRSHTMRSYRARFLRIYNACMCEGSTSSSSMEHLPHLPKLQNWLGILGARIVEIGSIAEPIVLRTATSVVPLGWTGLPGDKRDKSLIVDVQGYGLDLCTLVRAQVNGHWCDTTLESIPPPAFPKKELQHFQPKLQKMRVRVGPPVDTRPEKKENPDNGQPEAGGAAVAPVFGPAAAAAAEEGSLVGNSLQSLSGKVELPKVGNRDLGLCDYQGVGEVILQCSTDFMTATQDVVARLRRVKLLGLEGAGKTSLFFALLGGEGRTAISSDSDVLSDLDRREGVNNGINYVDAAGVNLQDLANETEQLRREVKLSAGRDGRKLDLVILVHNLAHKVPRLHRGDTVARRPVLEMFLDEINAAGIPVVLAITNKFAVSADQRHLAAMTIKNSYQVPSNQTVIINSCPYTVHGLSNESLDALEIESRGNRAPPIPNGIVQGAAQRLFFGPMRLVPRPFGKREVVLPIEGISKLSSLVHNILSANEEVALEEHAKQQLALQTAEDLVQRTRDSRLFGIGSGPAGVAAVGAAFGAGFGVVIAVVVGASRALRKP